jgi:hypothetical protein
LLPQIYAVAPYTSASKFSLFSLLLLLAMLWLKWSPASYHEGPDLILGQPHDIYGG